MCPVTAGCRQFQADGKVIAFLLIHPGRITSGGLSLMLPGFSFWSHNIAGLEERTAPDIYKRWTQFSPLSSRSRYYGNVEYCVPWIFDEEAVKVTRRFTKLKISLMPYLFRQAIYAQQQGIPVMCPMVFSYTNDPVAATLDRQFMLGENLLVAPIYNDGGVAEFYLPEGKWTNILTGKVYDGKTWYLETHGYMTLPLLAKENSIIVFGREKRHAAYDFTKKPIIHLYGFDGNSASSETEIFQPNKEKAATIRAESNGNEVTVEVTGLSVYDIVWHKQHGGKTKATTQIMDTKVTLK